VTIAIDASVGVKWFIEEQRSSAARKILGKAETLIAPDIFTPEISNAIWKKVNAVEISMDQGKAIVSNLPLFIDNFVPSSQLVNRAFDLAIEFNHPVYDCLYVALAERESVILITDDAKLLTLAKKAKLSRWVRSL
jgi:predicted nucleic acid-binding protein